MRFDQVDASPRQAWEGWLQVLTEGKGEGGCDDTRKIAGRSGKQSVEAKYSPVLVWIYGVCGGKTEIILPVERSADKGVCRFSRRETGFVAKGLSLWACGAKQPELRMF